MLPSASRPLAFSHLCSQSHSIMSHCDSGGHCLLVSFYICESLRPITIILPLCVWARPSPSIASTELRALYSRSSSTFSFDIATWPEPSLSLLFLQGGERTLDPSQVRAEAVPGGPPAVGRAPGAAAASCRGGRRPEVGGAAAGTRHQGGG